MLLYVITTRDTAAFQRWLNWIWDHRPCSVEIGSSCLAKGWLRFCTDDAVDKRCTFRPGNCALIKRVGLFVGVPADLCTPILEQFKIPTDIILPPEEFVIGGSALNEAGYPRHLAAVENLILRTVLGQSDVLKYSGHLLTEKEPRNPFFAYLSGAGKNDVLRMVLDLCPSRSNPSSTRAEWAWERTDGDEAWKKSMYWDCIFLGDLIKKM